ncbi:MAG TPA: DUF664 domain-containing protein [Sporichthyaceae bacterium]|jgi:hypothetical protein|nr:DUF664 domain-containing protein [Sporichthyaceae bacterium]
MDVGALLVELFGRIPAAVGGGLEGLDPADLRRAPAGGNPIGWLGWHLARVLDDHIAHAFDLEQVWVRDGWAPRFGFAPDALDTGYGHTRDQVAAVAPEDPQTVLDYLLATLDQAHKYVGVVRAADLDQVVDTSYDPPVTLGVRLVSVAEDCLQHAGQLGYVRGLLARD